MRVALDAGHGRGPGGRWTGACANSLVEDEVALDMVGRIGHHLRLAGHETLYTRPGEGSIGLARRTNIARLARCDVFLSIHCNAGRPSARGVEAFVAEGDTRSRELGQRLVGALAECGLVDRGVKWDSQSQHSRLAVLRGTYRSMPAVLLEIGFLTSPHDSALIGQRQWREKAARGIAGAL